MTTDVRETRVDARQVAAGFRWMVAAIVIAAAGIAVELAGWPPGQGPFTGIAAYCAGCGAWAWGWAAGYRSGAGTVARTVVEKIADATPEQPSVPRDPQHQAVPDDYCSYHERVHGPMEFGDLCQAWDDVERLERSTARRRRWLPWW